MNAFSLALNNVSTIFENCGESEIGLSLLKLLLSPALNNGTTSLEKHIVSSEYVAASPVARLLQETETYVVFILHIYTTKGDARVCVCVCVCKIGPISARTVSTPIST